MIPYKQLLPDNCVQVSIAAILDLPLENVPHFLYMLETPEKWVLALRQWLYNFSIDLVRHDGHFPVSGMYLVTGKSQRNTRHMVIYQSGRLLHDAHPDGTGLISIDSTYLLLPYNPSILLIKP